MSWWRNWRGICQRDSRTVKIGEIVVNEQKMVEDYFYDETKDFVIKELRLEETKYSYFDTIRCYYILTNEKIGF